MKDIKPKYLKKRARWQVDFNTIIPEVKDPWGDGVKMVDRRKSSFKTEDEALEWLALVRLAEKNLSLDIADGEKMVYKQAIEKLDEAGFGDKSLIDVVDYFLKYNKRSKSDKTIKECYDLWLQSYIDKAEKETRSGNTGSDVKRIERFLEPHFHRNVSVLDMPSVAEELVQQVRLDAEEKELSPVSLRNNLTKLNQFVNWLKRKDTKLLSYETTNEFEGLIKVEVPVRDAPYVLTPTEMREIIDSARLTDERCHLLPFFILHCFLGCRPSELIGMTWDNVKIEDTKEPFVLIPQNKTGKNKRPRRVNLTDFPAVVEWLRVCDRSKPFFAYNKDKNDKMERNFYDKRRIVLAEAVVLSLDASIKESKKYDDCGRHSCATYLYAGKWDAKTIAERIGNTEKVLLNHYIDNDKSKAEAVEYFSISPSKSNQKLVKFAG